MSEKDFKFKPIWNNKRYSIGYFIEGFRWIKVYISMVIFTKYLRKDGLHGVWTTFKAMILGESLLYEEDK